MSSLIKVTAVGNCIQQVRTLGYVIAIYSNVLPNDFMHDRVLLSLWGSTRHIYTTFNIFIYAVAFSKQVTRRI